MCSSIEAAHRALPGVEIAQICGGTQGLIAGAVGQAGEDLVGGELCVFGDLSGQVAVALAAAFRTKEVARGVVLVVVVVVGGGCGIAQTGQR